MYSNDAVESGAVLLEVRMDCLEMVEVAMVAAVVRAEFLPSEIAFASVLCARRLHKIEPTWNREAFESILKAAGQKSADMFYGRVKKCGELLVGIVKESE